MLHEFCTWIKKAEVAAATPTGLELNLGGDDEPDDAYCRP